MENEIDFEIENLLLDKVQVSDRKISVVTGEAAYDFIKKSVEKITDKWYNINCNVYKAKNLFFGGGVTVAGLLTGSDLVTALSGKELGEVLYIPSVMLRHEGDKFLDDLTIDELSQKLGVSVCPVTSDGAEFVASILGL